jgi:dTMP kinase
VPPLICSIDGPSDSGKSTLVEGIGQRYGKRCVILPCYVDAAGGDSAVPEAMPPSVEDRLEAFRFYLQIEAARLSTIAEIEAGIVVLDRSVHSLVAHVYAAALLDSVDAVSICLEELAGASFAIPDIAFYLQTDEETRRSRRDPADEGQWWTQPSYNAGFERYFSEEGVRLPYGKLVVADAGKSAAAILEDVVSAIDALLPRTD